MLVTLLTKEGISSFDPCTPGGPEPFFNFAYIPREIDIGSRLVILLFMSPVSFNKIINRRHEICAIEKSKK